MITVPTLVLTGIEDNNMPPRTQAEMAAQLPNGELILIENCGHLGLLECHAEISAHLRDFTRRCLE